MTDIKKQILNIKKSDDFLKKLCEIFYQEREDSKIFYQMVASLHNRGEINLIEEILKPSSQNHDFFTAKTMFEKVFPDLDISIQKSMDCVRHIFQKSGNDMSAGMVFSSFVEFCKKDEDRVKEALQIINSDTSWYGFIPSVISAGSEFNLNKYVEIAIKLTEHSDVNICKETVYSLGRLQYGNHPTSLNQSFQVIKNIIETTDDSGVLSISIGAIFTLFTFDNALEDETIHLIKIALKNSDDDVLYSASILCFLQEEKLSIKLFDVLLHGLERVNYKHTRTIGNIGYGLQYLLGKNQDMVVTYLEKTLMRNKELSITSFGSLLSDLHQKHNELLNQIITKWFILGNVNLCKATEDIVSFPYDNHMILSADISQLERQDKTTHLFVIRKAIGWLFRYPTSAVSFIISMVEVLDADNVKTIEELLFNPLLISYSGSVKDYLKSIKKPKTKTKKVILNLLKRLEKYHNNLECAGNIKELQPSEEQRESYFRLHNQAMSKAMQKSKKDNVFLSSISECIVLYGKRYVSYHPELGNDIRQEMPFQKFEYSIEYPSLDLINPHGLDYMLRVFRNEQFKK